MDRLRPLKSALALTLAVGLLLPLPSLGQAPAGRAGEDPDVFGETIDVRVVNLEVVVEDGQGRRVSGLAPSEFRLEVDGETVPVDYFTEVAEGKAVAEGTGAEDAPPAVEGTEPGAAVGTSYLVFIDDTATSITRDRNIVLKGLLKDLYDLRLEDRMAIVSFDGNRPRLLMSWSQSQADLRRVLEAAIQQPGHGNTAVASIRHFASVEAIGELPAPMPGTMGPPLPPPLDLVETAPDEACMIVRSYERSLERVAAALTATLGSFSEAPGRKVAVVASGRWPHSAKEWVLGTGYNRWPSGCRIQGPAVWDSVHEIANQVGFTLYFVQIAELTQQQDRDSQLRDTIDRLARETGGEAWQGGARRHLLARVAEDTRSFYWLGFTPGWKGDDRGHRVEVKVARPGLRVRSRLGFQDLSRETETTYRVERALLFDESPGMLPLKAELGPLPAKQGRQETVRVPLKLTIPMDQVTMVQKGGQYVAELELRVAMLDERGNRNDVQVIPVQLSDPEPPGPGQQAVYETEVEVRRIEQDVVVALFDPPSGKLMKTRAVLKP